MEPVTERIQISPSRLKTWLTCPLRWAAVYLEGKPIQVTPGMAFGSALHKALEAHHRSKWLGEDVGDLLEVFDVALGSELSPSPAPNGRARLAPEISEKEQTTMREHARLLIDAYLTRYAEEAVEAAEVRLEAPVVDPETGEDLGADLVGVVDLITAEGVLVDLKTAARASSELQVVLSHALQIDAYRYLLQHQDLDRSVAPAEIRSLIRGRNCRLDVRTIPERGAEPLLRVIRAYLRDLKQGSLQPRPGLLCSDSCPAIQRCRSIHGLEVAA